MTRKNIFKIKIFFILPRIRIIIYLANFSIKSEVPREEIKGKANKSMELVTILPYPFPNYYNTIKTLSILPFAINLNVMLEISMNKYRYRYRYRYR